MSATTPALALEDLSKQFGRIHAVRHLSLNVEPGQMAGFLGPNGAGKSTTLYMIPRLVRPSAGRIRIFGVDLWRDFKQAIRPVGVLVETPAFYEYLSGRKNLELSARVRGGVCARELDETLERIGLADRQHDRVGTYSMGMKQRLGIGWALLGRPRLLVLDEPTNGMDPEGTREILAFLRERVETDGLTVFLSSHLLHEVEEYCDTVFVIDHGRLVASGNVKDLLRPHERIVRVTFRDKIPPRDFLEKLGPVCQVVVVSADSLEITLGREDAAWLNERLLQAGYQVAGLVPKQKTLKEFFLAITGEQNHG
jgi:ABC-2 type transport system ATP-binding protein